ncbi:hypothetical protein NDU88_007937 [Pleurodeles waltl]|uniref:Uncharacterized protein n=1 Tax=Pleurodeles waltl TaxID=8319 RepID=A0AAV7QPD8_PLEWA|nr:hypothetical protein NDU88_007937 [Pleurodeles waltl]
MPRPGTRSWASGEPQACLFCAVWVSRGLGGPSPSLPIRPVTPRCPPVVCRGACRFYRGNVPELAALHVDGSLETEIEMRVEWGPLPSPLTPTPPDALFFAGGLDRTVQSAVAVLRLPRGLPSAGRPLTLGRGRPRRRRPPAIRVRWRRGHHISLGKSVISPDCVSRSPGKPL